MYYSDDLIEEIRSRNDIVDVISEHVKLKRKGATFFGLCPFHNEKSPSFSVTPSKQMYYCFGCGEGGNVYSFIMKYENDTFLEAVQMLAERAGVQLPEQEASPEEKKQAELKSQLLEINKQAAVYFHHQLKGEKGELAREYFSKRGLNFDTVVRFGLGYSNKTSNDLYQYFKQKQYSDDVLKETGLFSFSEKGTYDKFWNRVMFPILDVNGRVIGFGGRVLGEGEPKYLNSPETRIFEKSRNLYGMNLAKISRKNYLLICEGYMDVIALHSAGFQNAVAALGTAFTLQHAMLIKRYVSEVVLTFDSDGAGQKAAMRAIPILKSVGISIRVLDMQPYKDPDEFIKNLGAEAYEERITQAENSFLFEIHMLQKQYDMANPESKAEFYNKTAEKLLEFQEELERNVYLEAVSSKFGIPLESLKKAVRKLALHYTGPKEPEIEEKLQTKKKKPETNGIREAQKILLTWLIEDVSLYRLICDYINPDDFIEPLYHKVAKMLFEQLEQGIVNPAKILNNFIDNEEHREAAELFNTSLREEMTDKEKEQALNDTVRLVKRNSLDYISKNTTDIQVLQKAMQEKEKLKKLRITLWR